MRYIRKDIEFLISQYVDGQLQPRQMADLDRKLDKDPILREQLRLYESLRDRLRPDGGEALSDVDYELQREEITAAVERRALVEGLPSRPVLLRPAFRVLTAAATILVVASVGLLAYRYGRGAWPAKPEVSVSLVSISPASMEQSKLEISLRRLGAESLAMSALAPSAEGTLPSGTVVVSAGEADSAPPQAFDAGDMFFLAGIR